jgi:hypothetical protein
MTSQAYRQSAAWRAEPASKDAGSRWLWRFPPRRLTGEEIRDSLLHVSGQLDRTMGGPGFRLYDYQQDNVATYVPLEIHGRETFRRAVYHHNARAARTDVLTDFDCPDPAFADPNRAQTTTPIQALTMLNHHFSLERARAFAERLRKESQNMDQQIEKAFLFAFSRAPTKKEQSTTKALVQKHGLFGLCRGLLNANEFIYLN